MDRLDLLIEEARTQTENLEFTSQTGVQNSEYIRAFNDGQDRIQSLILNTYPRMFQKQKVITVQPNQETVDLPADLFLDARIEKIEFSNTGLADDYYKLDSGETDERLNTISGQPSFYIRESKTILIQPKPQAVGYVRVTYQRSFPRLDIRRGKVSDVTLDTVNNQITTLVLDPSLLTNDDITAMNKAEYLCIVSKDGKIKMAGIPITEVNGSTGQVMVEAFTFESGETIAVGDYAVRGKYTTTTSQLPDIAERYLLKFCEWRILKRDSSNDSIEANTELKEMEGDIVESYKKADFDVKEVPILDTQYLEFF